jgi:hypothetical protein
VGGRYEWQDGCKDSERLEAAGAVAQMDAGAAGFLDESVFLRMGSREVWIMETSCEFQEKRCAQVGSSDAGGLVDWDDLLGLTSRKMNRAMTRRRSRKRTFRFRDFLW